jgi:hypothetical protein
MNPSWFPPLVEFLALEADLLFQLIEKRFVLLADGIHQAGDE